MHFFFHLLEIESAKEEIKRLFSRFLQLGVIINDYCLHWNRFDGVVHMILYGILYSLVARMQNIMKKKVNHVKCNVAQQRTASVCQFILLSRKKMIIWHSHAVDISKRWNEIMNFTQTKVEGRHVNFTTCQRFFIFCYFVLLSPKSEIKII